MTSPLLPSKRHPDKRDVVSTDVKYRKVIAAWNGSITETAALAKVSPAFVKQVLANPKASREIKKRLDEACSHLVADKNERAMAATQILRDECNSAGERLKAMDLLNKMEGAYTVVHKVEGGEPIKAEFQLSLDQRLANLIDLATKKAEDIIDVRSNAQDAVEVKDEETTEES